MATRKRAQVVALTQGQRTEMELFAASRSLPHAQVERATIILKAAVGKQDVEIAQELSLSRRTVGKWRRRFLDEGIEGLYDELPRDGPAASKITS